MGAPMRRSLHRQEYSYRHLASAIIQRAVEDLRELQKIGALDKQGRPVPWLKIDMKFLFDGWAGTGEFFRNPDFEALCSFVGVEPDAVRRGIGL